ncbi:hypothetical protein PIB30_004396 [Stylosanthes scabra]|uniref:Uncharacterized protein n=1 Tax=Stylosanthes scabra TaxID=79078 RepID=A0ABU6V2K9_9FABA|nr:hypothetical protein [Stylosanthes scabra]
MEGPPLIVEENNKNGNTITNFEMENPLNENGAAIMEGQLDSHRDGERNDDKVSEINLVGEERNRITDKKDLADEGSQCSDPTLQQLKQSATQKKKRGWPPQLGLSLKNRIYTSSKKGKENKEEKKRAKLKKKTEALIKEDCNMLNNEGDEAYSGSETSQSTDTWDL